MQQRSQFATPTSSCGNKPVFLRIPRTGDIGAMVMVEESQGLAWARHSESRFAVILKCDV